MVIIGFFIIGVFGLFVGLFIADKYTQEAYEMYENTIDEMDKELYLKDYIIELLQNELE